MGAHLAALPDDSQARCPCPGHRRHPTVAAVSTERGPKDHATRRCVSGGAGTPAGQPVRHPRRARRAARGADLDRGVRADAGQPAVDEPAHAWATRIADAVAELRAIDLTYGPLRPAAWCPCCGGARSAPDAYPPLADLVDRCDAMRAATDGWFDAWAAPGGFDPSGLVKGWAVERAAARVRAAGITDYAVAQRWRPDGTGARTARRSVAGGGAPPVRRAPQATAAGDDLRCDRHLGRDRPARSRRRPAHRRPVDRVAAATVTGPDLAVADAYATALYAAGPAGLDWFPTAEGYRGALATP